jgi:hypothetical protein
MRTVNAELVDKYAEELRDVLPLARRAVGTQRPDSPARLASIRANELILEYVDGKGGNVTHLAAALDPIISLPGLRRRLRSARTSTLGSFSTSPRRGSKDPALVAAAVKKIQAARVSSSEEYRDAVRDVYANNVSLSAVADELGITYYSLWSAGSTS